MFIKTQWNNLLKVVATNILVTFGPNQYTVILLGGKIKEGVCVILYHGVRPHSRCYTYNTAS